MQHSEQELNELKEKLLVMASHAETAVRQSVEALLERDDELAARVRVDDTVIDRLEIEIDDLAIHLLAKAPLATNLRLITVAMRASQNLERVGDEATKIAKRVLELNKEVPLKLAQESPQLCALALRLLKQALDAFVQSDSVAARELIPQDKQVDELNQDIHRKLVDHMVANPPDIPRCLHLMVISKSLERVADHAKNLAEEIVYLREAEDIRHAKALAAAANLSSR